MPKNPILEKRSKELNWHNSSPKRLEQRLTLFQGLADIEKAERNYKQLFELQKKMDILNYLIHSKKPAKG